MDLQKSPWSLSDLFRLGYILRCLFFFDVKLGSLGTSCALYVCNTHTCVKNIRSPCVLDAYISEQYPPVLTRSLVEKKPNKSFVCNFYSFLTIAVL